MKYQIPLIALAVFSIIILLAQNNAPAIAQLTFTTTTINYNGISTENESQCNYLNSLEVWCSSDDGIKIINPTSRTITQTLYAGIDINDVVCGSAFCYSWHGGGSATANLTQWDIDTHDVTNNRTFTMSGGGNLGRDIDVISLQGAENILLPSSSTSCIGSGGTTLKGLCIWDGNIWNYTTRGFISSGDTGNSAILFGIKFAESTDIFEANVLILYQDGAGTRTLRILNLADADTTFANTQICTPTSATGLSAVNNVQIYVYESKFMFPFDNGATGLYLSTPIDSTTCATSTEFVTTWDIPSSLTTDGEFWYIGSTQSGATARSAVQVFNLTSSVSFATYNTTNTTAPALPLKKAWYHSTEGELQVLGNDRILTFQVQEPSTGGTVTICYIVEETGQQFCKTYDTDENGNPIIPSVIGGANPRNITDTTGEFFCTIGLTDCSNPDIQTNGTGMFMLLILVLVSYALVVYIHHIAKQSIMGIHPMLVLLIGIIDISIAFFLGWIPDYIFYSVIVLLVGLGGFGLYKIIRGQ